MERIVLAYSGGLDTSVAIAWLAERFGAEIVAVTLDLGQGQALDEIRERALRIGAVRAHVLDAREEFARDYVLPALRAGAVYEGRYLLATALGRPLIARKLVEIAAIEQATAIAHGCTGKDNDQVRIEVSARAIDPRIAILAPAREWGMSRADTLAYARARGIPVPADIESPYRTDTNLWGRSIESGPLDDPWQEPPEEVFTLTKAPGDCADRPAYVEVEFERGTPVKVNGVGMPPVELISSLATIAGAHGVGRLDLIENRVVGIKTREVYEAPAAVVLHAAHRELEALVISRDLDRVKQALAVEYADLVYDGLWFTPLRDALDAFVLNVQERVTGTIRVRLFRGSCSVVGRRSAHALYDEALAGSGDTDRFDHRAAAGFIHLFGLPAELAGRRAREAQTSATSAPPAPAGRRT